MNYAFFIVSKKVCRHTVTDKDNQDIFNARVKRKVENLKGMNE